MGHEVIGDLKQSLTRRNGDKIFLEFVPEKMRKDELETEDIDLFFIGVVSNIGVDIALYAKRNECGIKEVFCSF